MSLDVAAFLCDGMDGMVDAERRMEVGVFIRRAAVRSDSDGSMMDSFVYKIYYLM